MPNSNPVTSARPKAMKSPVRFMARGLAEAVGIGKAHDVGRECDGNGGGGGKRRGGSRQAPAERPAIIQ